VVTNVKITLNMPEISQLLNAPQGPVGRLVSRRVRRVRSLARTYCPKDTGQMEARIGSSVNIQAFREVRGEVISKDGASWWVNRGTGIFDRDGSTGPIFPKRSQFLRFPDRGGVRPDRHHAPADAGWVYARSVKGQKAQEFMWRGLRDGVRGTAQTWTVIKLVP